MLFIIYNFRGYYIISDISMIHLVMATDAIDNIIILTILQSKKSNRVDLNNFLWTRTKLYWF